MVQIRTLRLMLKSKIAAMSRLVVPQVQFTRAVPKVGRNDPCPCGNGKNSRNAAGVASE